MNDVSDALFQDNDKDYHELINIFRSFTPSCVEADRRSIERQETAERYVRTLRTPYVRNRFYGSKYMRGEFATVITPYIDIIAKILGPGDCSL